MPKISLRKPLTIVITVEGLATSALGCYGCSWNSTPAIDSLAATGTVWDRWMNPVDQSDGLINQWLRDLQSEQLAGKGSGHSLFMTDCGTLDFEAASEGFDSVVRLEPNLVDQPAESIDETSLASAFAELHAQVSSQTTFAWLHLDLFRKQWDAPVERLVDSDETTEPVEDVDAEPTEIVEPFQLADNTEVPSLKRTSDDDPDLMFAWMQRYGAQVRLLDEMVDGLLDVLRRRSPTVVLAGASGFSLGQNGWVGHRVGPLRSNEVRLPLVMTGNASLRVPGLESASALPGLLAKVACGEPLVTPSDWCRSEEEFAPIVVTESDRCDKAVTTPQWFYVQDQAGGEECLYLKPDDVEDMNNVARLRYDVVDRLSQMTGEDGVAFASH